MKALTPTAVTSFWLELEKVAKVVPIVNPERHGSQKPSSAELAEFRKREASAGCGEGDGCSLGKDKDGFYAYTHRARCKSYPSPSQIPLDRIKFVASTA